MKDGFWVEILAAGDWTDANGTRVNLSVSDLEQIAASHAATCPEIEPALRLGDHPGLEPGIKPAVGFVPQVKVEGSKLLGYFTDVPEIVLKAFEARRYKTVSAGLWRNVRHKGQTHPWLLNHVAILGAELPAVRGLADLQAYMTDGSGIAVPETVFCFSHPKEGTDMTDLEKKLADDLEKATTKLNEATAKVVNLTAERDGLQTKVTTLEGDKKALTDQIAEFSSKALQTEVETLVDAAIKAERLLPADRDKAIKAGIALRSAAGANFKAGDGSPFDSWKDLLASGGKAVNLSEKGQATPPDTTGQAAEIEAARASALRVQGRQAETK